MNIEFFFDIASPYSYLASTQVDALAASTGVPVRWRPFLLGGVFKATANQPPAATRARAPWLLRDLQLWAEEYQVPFTFPAFFPVNSLVPMRALCALPESEIAPTAKGLFKAHWADSRDPSDLAVLTELVGESLIASAASQPAKDLLRANSEEAVARGAFGAPTFFVGVDMFFGNDRLHFVEAAARKLA